jgi:deazaflavin-dependent oxidoreductase (nitroreductase family)
MPMTAFDRLLGLRVLALHQFIYERTGGRVGHRMGKASMLLLQTTGRKTGHARTVSLLYHLDHQDYVVVGSKGGSDAPPAWLLNLQANPEVALQIGTERFPARARVANPDERRRLWVELTKIWPHYNRYQAQTARQIPLVILTQPEKNKAEAQPEPRRKLRQRERRRYFFFFLVAFLTAFLTAFARRQMRIASSKQIASSTSASTLWPIRQSRAGEVSGPLGISAIQLKRCNGLGSGRCSHHTPQRSGYKTHVW